MSIKSNNEVCGIGSYADLDIQLYYSQRLIPLDDQEQLIRIAGRFMTVDQYVEEHHRTETFISLDELLDAELL